MCPSFPLQNILASACANEAENARHVSVDGDATGTGAVPSSSPASSHVAQKSTANTRTPDRPAGM